MTLIERDLAHEADMRAVALAQLESDVGPGDCDWDQPQPQLDWDDFYDPAFDPELECLDD